MDKARVMYFKLGKSYYFEPAEVEEKGLDDLYKLIGCTLVEPVSFTIKGVEYTLWCDKEFLLKPNPVLTMFSPIDTMSFGNLKRGEFTVICGNFIVCKCEGFCNEEGEYDEKIVSLTDEEIADIRAFIDEGQIKPKLAFSRGLIRSNRC